MANTFRRDKQRGKFGERVVRSYFRSVGADVRDTSEDSSFQEEDVDLLLADGLKYEVKTDYRLNQTGNLALEDSVTNAHGTTDSWLWTSAADRFAFVNPSDTSEFYVIDAEDLRHLARTERLRKARCDDGYKVVHLLLLDLGRYRDCFEVIHAYPRF